MSLLVAAALMMPPGPARTVPTRTMPARTVPAWTASQQPVWGEDFLFPTNIPAQLGDRSLRQVVRLGIGGRAIRLVLSNAYGTRPLTIAAVHAAPSRGGSRIDPVRDRAIRFGTRASVTIAPGATITSDLSAFPVKAGENLAITIRFAHAPDIRGFHWDGRRTGYVLAADQIAAADPPVKATTTARLVLAAVLVDASHANGTVVVVGDSITDGAGATLDADTRWPDHLAKRAAPAGIAVVNAGISGARLLSDGMGANALARLHRDALAQPGIGTIVVALGINDIAWPGTPFDPQGRPVDFAALVEGYRAIVASAHASKVRVIGTTLPPFADALPDTPLHATYYSVAKDALRGRINEWIRRSGTFDAVVDFDHVLRDPKRPDRLAPAYDSGDHLHPGDAGNAAMADALPLSLLLGH